MAALKGAIQPMRCLDHQRSSGRMEKKT